MLHMSVIFIANEVNTHCWHSLKSCLFHTSPASCKIRRTHVKVCLEGAAPPTIHTQDLAGNEKTQDGLITILG